MCAFLQKKNSKKKKRKRKRRKTKTTLVTKDGTEHKCVTDAAIGCTRRRVSGVRS